MFIKRVVNGVRDLIRRDRIRVGPDEGRLLRLTPPCLLTIGLQTVTIVSRTVSQTQDGPRVRYGCETEDGSAELTIRLTPAFRTDVTWSESGRDVGLAESDIVVFG